MRYLSILGAAAVAAVALIAFAGTASATMFYNGQNHKAGETMAAGSTATMESTGEVKLHASGGTATCKKGSTLKGEITDAGGGGIPVKGKITATTWKECSCTPVVLKNGTLEANYDGGTSTSATVKSTGLEMTLECFGLHCIYTTNGTTLGTLTGSSETGITGTLDVAAKGIATSGGRSGAFCGTELQWEGSYSVTAPDRIDVTNI